MALSRNREPKKPSRRSRAVRANADKTGGWFDFVVFLLMIASLYFIGALMDGSWTGLLGREVGKRMREAGGGALIVPLMFLVYLCFAWFAKSRIPNPLGQIAGTFQLYLSVAFMLGLFAHARWALPWKWAEPGSVGGGLARFFVLNLGALGTLIVAFASLALAAILFGFRLPFRFVRAGARLMERKPEERPVREELRAARAARMEHKASSLTIRTSPRPEAEFSAPPAANDTTPLPPVEGHWTSWEPVAPPEKPVAREESVAARPEPELPTPSTAELPEEPEESAETQTFFAAENRPPEPLEDAPPPVASPALSRLILDPAQIVEIQAVPRPSLEEQIAELKGLLSREKDSAYEAESTPYEAGSAYEAPHEAPLPFSDGRDSAVQEAFPEVQLPEDEETGRVLARLFPPPLDIFGPAVKAEDEEQGHDLAEHQASIIVTTLQNFGVKANVAHIVIGPSVIQFQLELAPGIKVSKVAGLVNDLTMALAVVSVRVEAPILGQRYVGIEIPNPKRKGITLRSIMESEEFQRGDCALPLPMGVRVDSKHLVCGLEDMPHLLVAGTTGSGKSVYVNSCILGMCSQRTPEELKLILVDPKHVEFAIYEGLPHLLARPVSDPKKAIFALSWAVQEMERRSECFARAKVRNLASYNEKALPKHRFPNIVVVVDELADLMYTAGKEVEGLIARLAQKARAAGIHLILATQRPSVDVITGLIKANVPARVAFAVPSQTDSRTIIDTGGAEKLLGKGDMLFYSTRYPRPLRLQAAFITEERTLEFVEYMKNAFGEPEYIEFEDPGNGVGTEGGRSGSSIIDDPKLDEAIKVVMDTGIASASGLQRYLNIGYPRAGRMISGLEQLGVVGPQPSNSSKPREILMDEERALEALERARNGVPFEEE